MNSATVSAFKVGSGIDPTTVKLVLLSITGAIAFAAFAWFAARVFEAYQDNAITAGDVISSVLLLLIALSFLLYLLGRWS